MEFERKELEMIKQALEEKGSRTLEYIKEWDKSTWENIGDMQGMYANEQAFEEHKEMLMTTWNNIYEEIGDILERIYEEI